MRQFGKCGYCGVDLTDSFHVDHRDEDCGNDSRGNLCACCGTCHATKTMHYRMGRVGELSAMLLCHDRRRLGWDERWGEEDDHWCSLPEWLRCRVRRRDAQLHHLCMRPDAGAPVSSWERFRFTG